MADILPALASRRARRAFATTPVPIESQRIIWEAVSLAPSHGNCQPVRLLVAGTPESRARLLQALSKGNREWAGSAPLLLAIAADPAHDNVQTNLDESTRELWQFHAGIATGNLLVQATALGLTAHPMAGFDEAAVLAVFAAPPSVRVLAVVAIGYPGEVDSLVPDLRARETAPQRRLPRDILVANDVWQPRNAISWREFRDQPKAR